MKKKFSLTLISILSVVVLVGVGFAAWIITTPNVQEKQTGTITASGVTDARYELTAAITNGSIVFGRPSGYSNNNSDWFKPGSDVGDENLTATLTLTLTDPKGNALDETVFNNYLPDTFTFTMNATKADAVDNTGFGNEVTAGRIKYPTISYTASGATSATTKKDVAFGTPIEIAKSAFEKGTDGKYTLTITITFAWGNDGNPYTYFHGKEQTTELVTKALGYNAMKTNLEGVGYEVTIASKANA